MATKPEKATTRGYRHFWITLYVYVCISYTTRKPLRRSLCYVLLAYSLIPSWVTRSAPLQVLSSSLSHFFLLCPTTSSLRTPRGLLSPRPPAAASAALRPTVPLLRPEQRVFPAAPEAAGWLPRSADRADCLYGWLAGWLCRRSHPAGHLPLLPRVCRQSAGVYLALPASL